LGNAKLQGEVEVLLRLLFILLHHTILSVICLFIVLKFFLLLLLLSELLLSFPFQLFSLKDSAPISTDIFGNPIFDLKARNTLHAKNLQANVILAGISIGNSLHVNVMTSPCMLNHRIDGCKFFRAFGTMEVLCLLMVMKNDFVLERLFTVETKWLQT
jgi:hypothetical protein